MTSGQDLSVPNYTRPPVEEVVFGVRFKLLEALTVPYWGRLWDRYAGRFPLAEQQPRLVTPPKTVDEEPDIRPESPRVWFIDEPGNRLVQAQSDCFFYNWRRISQDDPYPGFGELFAEFNEHLQTFRGFLEEWKLGPTDVFQYELSYFDVMPFLETEDSIAALGRIFPHLSWRGERPAELSVGTATVWRGQFALPDGRGTLAVAIATGARKLSKARIVRLETKAICPEDRIATQPLGSWFPVAHRAIDAVFTCLTDPEMQSKDWGRAG